MNRDCTAADLDKSAENAALIHRRNGRRSTGEKVTMNATASSAASVAGVYEIVKIDQETRIQKAILAEAAR